MTITIEIPAVASAVAQDAMKDAAWKIAKEIARAETFAGDEFFSHLAPTAEARAEADAQINGLMNAAATLDGRATRDDWAGDMIRECANEVEA